MKLRLLQPFLFLFLFTAVACSKKDCPYKSKYVYEPLVYDVACQCIVSGKVKYMLDCQTAALLDYGNGNCDNKATKIICKSGNCETVAGARTQTIQIDCAKAFEEGPISEQEAAEIGI